MPAAAGPEVWMYAFTYLCPGSGRAVDRSILRIEVVRRPRKLNKKGNYILFYSDCFRLPLEAVRPARGGYAGRKNCIVAELL